MTAEDERQAAMDKALREWGERTNEIATALVADNPGLHPLTASVMANDILSADHRTKQVAAGEAKAEDVVWLVGSFARWDWAVTMVAEGRLADGWFCANIADLWRGSDPDDTNLANLAIWKRCFRLRGGLIRDGRPLPKPKSTDGRLSIYRGGSPFTVKQGFAWTTDPKIAAKFAATWGQRQPMPNGVVITGLVRPSSVLAYLTKRGESEVIVDPRLVENIHPVAAKS